MVLLSVVGTLITDNLTDNLHISLTTTTIVFSVALAATFACWYLVEKSLSIHSIFTTRREAFYWLTILFTFALGTAAGDLVAEKAGLGYLVTLLMVAGLIALVTLAHFYLKLNGILAFWIAYVLTRPLGASIGDYLSQPHNAGGLALGTTKTSGLFLALILGLVIYLVMTKKDVLDAKGEGRAEGLSESAGAASKYTSSHPLCRRRANTLIVLQRDRRRTPPDDGVLGRRNAACVIRRALCTLVKISDCLRNPIHLNRISGR